jgi:hypothetical protein
VEKLCSSLHRSSHAGLAQGQGLISPSLEPRTRHRNSLNSTDRGPALLPPVQATLLTPYLCCSTPSGRSYPITARYQDEILYLYSTSAASAVSPEVRPRFSPSNPYPCSTRWPRTKHGSGNHQTQSHHRTGNRKQG